MEHSAKKLYEIANYKRTELKNIKQAKIWYEEVISTYPDSPEAGQAKKHLEWMEKFSLKGLGGWLIAVAIDVTSSPLFMVIGFYQYPSFIASEDFSFASFTDKTLIWSEAIFYFTMIFVMAYVAFLFFTKRREFPNWFIGTSLVLIAYNIANFSFPVLLFSESLPEGSTGISLVEVFLQMLWPAIWIAYMLKSERVRRTFVED